MTDVTPLVASSPTDDTHSALHIEASQHSPHQQSKAKRRSFCMRLLAVIILLGIGIGIGFAIQFLLEELDKNTNTNSQAIQQRNWPIVASTWPWTGPIETAWSQLMENIYGDSLDAVQVGCEFCEENPAVCDWSVGYGGSPDTNGLTTLDAMIMHGPTHDVGAVAQLRNIKHAIAVARHVMHYTTHSMLVGQDATDFAVQMNFTQQSLNGSVSWSVYQQYLRNNCQPNAWKNVQNASQCPPYTPIPWSQIGSGLFGDTRDEYRQREWTKMDHDTIGVIAIDSNGSMSIGTSTNGATMKIPGRVGDTAIIGKGGYLQQGIGGCVGTGDGDIMMRFAPCRAAVIYMKYGMNVEQACQTAVDDMVEYYPGVYASLVCMSANGEIGAGTASAFWYTFRDLSVEQATVITVDNPYTTD